MPGTLLSLSSQIPDPRRGQEQMYRQAPILLYTVLAMLAGAVSYRQVHAFIRIHLSRLNSGFGVSMRKAQPTRRCGSSCAVLRGVMRRGNQRESGFSPRLIVWNGPATDSI